MRDTADREANGSSVPPSATPLAGVRVLDLTQALSGPYATLLLADLGADVVKVESPGRGDDSRHWGPPFVGPPDESVAAYFLSVNRNKRSVALDLKSPGGARAARELAARADVVVENFRPGTADRLGLGARELRERHPRLVHCSVSGFGADGPPRAGYDQIVQGMAGLMSLTGEPDGAPTKLGVPIADLVAGMFAAHAVLAALYERERTGVGRTVDVAMHDSVVALLCYQATRLFATGREPGRDGNHHATIAPYGMFASADGHLNVAVGNDGQWRRLCEALGAPALADDPRFATNPDRLAHRGELHAEIGPLLAGATTAALLERLERAGVPAGPIRGLDEVFADPAVQARNMQLRVDHPVWGPVSMPGGPWKLDGRSVEARREPPLLGQHTREVLAELGWHPDEIETLTSGGDAAPTTGVGTPRDKEHV